MSGVAASLVMLSACRETPSAIPVPPRIVALRIVGDDTLRLAIGSARHVMLEAVDEHGKTAAVTASWHVDDRGVAWVDERGLVRATTFGVTAVTATYGSLSAQVTVISIPAALRLRLDQGGSVVEPGAESVVHAEFLDVEGRVVAVPWQVSWSASPGLALKKGNDPAIARAVVRTNGSGDFEIMASAGHLSARLMISSIAILDVLQIVEFRMGIRLVPRGWLYVPDLLVASIGDLQVTRITFVGMQAACGVAAVPRGVVVRLFDFQPYNFAWFADPLPIGTPVEVAIEATLADGRSIVQRATAKVEATDGIIDYGTDGFPWASCG